MDEKKEFISNIERAEQGKQIKLDHWDAVNFIALDQDPEADPEVVIILETCQEIYPKIDVENVKIKEEEKNR